MESYGVILFANDRVRRVSAGGGDSSNVTEIDESLGENFHATPRLLPDGHHFVFKVWSEQPENRAIYIGSLGLKDAQELEGRRGQGPLRAAWLHLFVRQRTLLARQFDAGRQGSLVRRSRLRKK